MRAHETSLVARYLELARAGRVRLVVVRGAHGSGKTWLAAWAVQRLLGDFEVVHVDLDGGGGRTEGDKEGDKDGVVQTWCARLGAEGVARPLAVVVDGLRYLGGTTLGDIERLVAGRFRHPVVVLLTCRPHENRSVESMLGRWLPHERTRLVELRPLDRSQVARCAEQVLEATPEDAFVDECVRLTTGLPGRLVPLLRAVRARGVPPTATEAATLATVGHRLFAQEYRARMAVLGPDARAVLTAVAVLRDTERDRLAALVGLSAGTVARALRELTAECLLPADCHVPHPVVCDAVLACLDEAEALRLRADAARVLYDAAASPAVVARQLTCLRNPREPWMRDILRHAAVQTERSDPRLAARCLALLLCAEQSPQECTRIRYELVRTLGNCHPDAALAAPIGRILAKAARALPAADRPERPRGPERVVERPKRRLPALDGGIPGFRASHLAEDGPPPRPAPPEPRATAAAVHDGGSAERVVERVQQLLADGPHDALSTDRLALALVRADRADLADQVHAEALEEAGRYGDDRVRDLLLLGRVVAHCELGRFNEAAAGLTRLGGPIDEPAGREYVITRLLKVRTLAGQNHDARADQVLAALSADRAGVHRWAAHVWEQVHSLARRGDYHGALRELNTRARVLEAEPCHLHNFYWWYDASELLLRTGRTDTARRLLEYIGPWVASWGTATAVGRLRTCAGLAAGTPRAAVEALSEADTVLAESPNISARASTKIHLGTALYKAGHSATARLRLREAVLLTERHGAHRLRAQASAALVLAGGRRIRAADDCSLTRLLTRSERRVTALAADGWTNREIAEHLYVTVRTVEAHLTSAYRKLGILGRRELPGVLKSMSHLTNGGPGDDRSDPSVPA